MSDPARPEGSDPSAGVDGDESIEQFLREEARVMTSREFDARVLDAARSTMEGRRTAVIRFPWRVAAAALLVAGVGLGGVEVVRRIQESGKPGALPETVADRGLDGARPSAGDPAGSDLTPTVEPAREPVEQHLHIEADVAAELSFTENDPEDEDPVKTLHWPAAVSARDTLAEAPAVLGLRPLGTVADSPAQRDALLARVVTVFKGDADLLDRDIVLLTNHSSRVPLGHSRRSVLCQGHADLRPTKTSELLVAVAPASRPQDPLGRPRMRPAFSEGRQGIWVDNPAQGAVMEGGEEALELVLASLFRTTHAASTTDALAAVRSLRVWHGESRDGLPVEHSELWSEPSARDHLLALSRSASAEVRWNLAWMIPASAGELGREALLELLFDEDAGVREPAAYLLAARGDAVLTDALERCARFEFRGGDESGDPGTVARHGQCADCPGDRGTRSVGPRTRRGTRVGGGSLGASRARERNRRGCARPCAGGGRCADSSCGGVCAPGRRSPVAGRTPANGFHGRAHRPRCCRAFASPLGRPRRARQILEELRHHPDLRVAVQAVRFLAEAGGRRSSAPIFAALEDPRAVVRVHALMTVIGRGGSAAEQALENCKTDSDPLVREAALALERRQQHRNDLEERLINMGYVLEGLGYATDDG